MTALVMLLFYTSGAFAYDVVAVKCSNNVAMNERMRAELKVSLFDVQQLDAVSQDESGADMFARLQATSKISALVICSSESNVIELFFSNEENQTEQRFVVIPADAEDPEGIAAVQLTELLRTALVDLVDHDSEENLPAEIDTTKTEPVLNIEVDLTQTALVVKSPPKHRVYLTLGMGPMWSTFSNAPAANVYLNMGVRLKNTLHVQVLSLLPTGGISIDEPGTVITVRTSMVAAGLALKGTTNQFVWKAGVGYGVWILSARTDSTQVRNTNDDLRAVTGPCINLEGGFMFTSRFGILASVIGGMTVAKVIYQVELKEIGTFGQPILGLALGAMWNFGEI
jgi:hypothetical protein